MTLLTCIGEALIDFLPIEEDGRTVGFRMHPGGSLLNVAVAAARLSQPVALASKLSTDFFGRHLRRYAEAEGVETRWLAESDAPSTLAFVATETGEPAFSFYGDGAADTLLTPPELPAALFDQTSILHVGSISLLRGTTPAAVLDACQRMAGRGLISLDPNVRPNLVNDEPAYRALLAQLTRLADVVKVSAADLAWLAPGAGMDEAAAALLAEGPGLVVVTHGGEGVLAFRDCANPGGPPGGPRGGPPEAISVPAFAVEVADTVGAGDAFDAGLLAWLGEHGITSRAALDGLPPSDLREALRFAAAVAALNCTRAGADPPRLAAVEAFMSPSERSGPDGEGENDDRRQ